MNNTNVKPFVFVLMPFHSDFDDIYQLGIKAACVSAGAYCERVDEQIFAENILDRVYNQIAKADLIVSEMTGRNPNVFYETGYAHALKKQVILLTQNADDIPFDLKHYPHIIYNGKITQLKTDLEKRIKWFIDNPGESISKLDLDFEFLINGVTLQEGLEIEIPYKDELSEVIPPYSSGGVRGIFVASGNVLFSLQIGIHNTSSRVVEGSSYHLGLIVPTLFSQFIKKSNSDVIATLNGQSAIIRPLGFRTVFPDDWNSVDILFSIKEDDLNPFSATDFILRLFSELGVKDYQFKVRFVSEKR